MTTQCVGPLTESQLEAFIQAGYKLIGGPYPTRDACLVHCTGTTGTGTASGSPGTTCCAGVGMCLTGLDAFGPVQMPFESTSGGVSTWESSVGTAIFTLQCSSVAGLLLTMLQGTSFATYTGPSFVNCTATALLALQTSVGGPWPSTVVVGPGDCGDPSGPTITPSSANLCSNAGSINITCTTLDPTPSNNSFAFNLGAVGACTAVSGGVATVVFSVEPTPGALTAVATTPAGSSDPAQVALVIDCGTGTGDGCPRLTDNINVCATSFGCCYAISVNRQPNGTWTGTGIAASCSALAAVLSCSNGNFSISLNSNVIPLTGTTTPLHLTGSGGGIDVVIDPTMDCCGGTGTGTSSGSGSSPDGATCATAITLVQGVTRSGTLAAGQVMWFKSAVNTVNTYYIKDIVGDGENIAGELLTGTSCGDATIFSGYPSPGGCLPFSSPVNGFFFMFIDNLSGGPIAFSLQFGSGACP